ncbi:MAG: aminotransferase class I/II-fold pyridoxal phosphate-dependent enzyme [Bacillota bacterium]|nr:aminotransferase class I/II-fold pyridoxal phosphate-dependent enzyme [Bacillota bacterium]
MSGREMEYIKEAFAANWIAPLGPHVDAFEKELAEYVSVRGALALSSGTSAIHLALLLTGVRRGDRVFCSSLTFAATANPILYVGAEPVFIDAEPQSWNISTAALARAFEDAGRAGGLPKAVIITDLYGQSADMEPVEDLCNRYGVDLIEDAAEALGATYRDRRCGSFGRFGILSFNGNKIITTSGGGALLSNDEEALERARYLATQARQPVRHYEHTETGYNYRLSNVLAGIGRGQLTVLEQRVAARRAVFARYRESLGDIDGFEFMPEAGYGQANRWLTALTVNPDLCGMGREQIIDALEAENIEARPVWKPMHRQPLYEGTLYYPHEGQARKSIPLEGREGKEANLNDRGELSISDDLFEKGLCLPSGSNMSIEDQERVIEVIKDLL